MFIVGLIVGAGVVALVVGAISKEKERDAYIQGFHDGQESV